MVEKWVPIYVAPEYGESPYNWSSSLKDQCTWFAYYRVQKPGWSAPCYNNRAKKTEGWANAKNWPENFREPWQPIYIADNPNYKPVPGDIIVFTGNYGHVAVIESTITLGQEYWISDFNRIQPNTYDCCKWNVGDILHGYINTGKPVAYLHYGPNTGNYVTPVERNTAVNQIYAPDSALRVRTLPNLAAEFYCFITPGYYNVLSTTEATEEDKAAVEGLECWYEIEEDKYCANITTTYLPKGSFDDIPVPNPTPNPESDVVKLLKQLEAAVLALDAENAMLKTRNAELQQKCDTYQQGLQQIADIVNKTLK